MSDLLEQFKSITTIISDIDGVFTNGQLLVTDSGEMQRLMNVRDGYAVVRALKADIDFIVITGGNSAGVEKRMRYLGVKHYYSAVNDKLKLFEELEVSGLIPDRSTCLYIGDDLADIPLLKEVGLSCAPNDAIQEILKIADYISPAKGGQGCIRDIIEKILKLRGIWL